MKRAALYVRVSTQEQRQHGLSVDNQVTALKEYCRENNLEVYKVYSDAGISGHISYRKRPALLQMIDDCQNKNVDIVLITRLDRFFRSVPDYYAVIERMNGVPWKAIWEDYETETSSGQFKVNIMLSIAEAEASRTSEKIKSVLQYKKERGDYLGRPPIGYIRVDGKLIKDPDTREVVELTFETFLHTWSCAKTLDALAAAGHPSTNDTLRRRLKNATYCGDAHGLECEPYITRQQHEDIIRAFENHVRDCKQKYDYIFTGLCRCGYCGKRMAATSAKSKLANGSFIQYRLYSCNGNRNLLHKTIMITEKSLQSQLIQRFDSFIEEAEAKAITESKDLDYSKEIQKLQKRLSRIGIRFEDGDITVEEYREKRNEIQMKIREYESMVSSSEFAKIPEGWQNIYEDLTNVGKRAFWRSFIQEIVITHENKSNLTSKDIKLKMG